MITPSISELKVSMIIFFRITDTNVLKCLQIIETMAEQKEGSSVVEGGDDSKDSDTKKTKFSVDKDLIPASKLSDETDDLKGLGLDVFNQDEFEKGMMFFRRLQLRWNHH